MGNPSYATITPANISLSPMQIVFNGVDLGAAVDSVDISVKPKWADIKADQTGDTPLDKVLSGQTITVKTTLAEIKNKNNWSVAFPYVYQVSSSTGLIYMPMQVGFHLLSTAQLLTLHPLEAAANDVSENYTFWKAAAFSATEIKYGPDKQTGLMVEWVIFPDTSTTPYRIMAFGDTTIGLVNASAGSATPGSNTGNGTIGSIAVTNGVTKTETITVTCVGTHSGNQFYVSGSLSGALGEISSLAASSGSTANFAVQTGSPDVISFTITQGSTQFAYGDSFTIATTAANYT